jgi:general secretion pathway protein G
MHASGHLVTWLSGQLTARRRRPRTLFNDQITRCPDDQMSGFTLIELLVVASIIIVLATMGVVQYRNSVIRSREAVLKEDLFRMRDAIDQFYADKTMYPSALDALVSDGYLRKMPVDPFTGNADSWQTVPAEPDPNNPTATSGVYDVKSGAEGTALDGTNYSDW